MRPKGSPDRHGRCVRAVTEGEADRLVAGVGPRIRLIREESDVSATELAAALEINPLTVHHWEAGRRNPTLGNVYRVAAALGVRVSDVLET